VEAPESPQRALIVGRVTYRLGGEVFALLGLRALVAVDGGVAGRVDAQQGGGGFVEWKLLVCVDVDDLGRGSGVAREAHPDLFDRETDGGERFGVYVVLDRPWRVGVPQRQVAFLTHQTLDWVAVHSAAAGVV
jgi:hypothetical protein